MKRRGIYDDDDETIASRDLDSRALFSLIVRQLSVSHAVTGSYERP